MMQRDVLARRGPAAGRVGQPWAVIFGAMATACVPAWAADTFDMTLLPATSSATWSFSVTAPFALAGASNILGSFDAASNPTGTRTIPGFTGGDTNGNTPVPLTAGSASASGSSGATPLHPAGVFRLTIDPEAARSEVRGLSMDFLNGASVSAGTNVSITYGTFRTRQPTCLIFGGIPINVPLGNATLTSLAGVQDSAVAAGTLTASGPDRYQFAIPVTLTVSVGATFNGVPLDVPPQAAAVFLAGEVVIAGGTATATAGFQAVNDQTQPGPVPLNPVPFTEPLCQGSLLVNVSLASVQTHVEVGANVSATGVIVPPACDPDITQDGNVDQDDVAYLVQIVAGGANPLNADPDFNQDGNADQSDVAALVGVVAGAPCP